MRSRSTTVARISITSPSAYVTRRPGRRRSVYAIADARLKSTGEGASALRLQPVMGFGS